MNKRSLAIGVAAATAGAIAGPPVFATAADTFKDVVVRNTADNPVLTKATGTTAVSGVVDLAPNAKVGLADGTKVSLAGTVPLAPGTKVGLDAPVLLADGTKVGLADGTKVDLAEGASVKVGNGDTNPVPVKVVSGGSGGGGATPAMQPMSFASLGTISEGQRTGTGAGWTVPAGKVFVLTRASGFATDNVGRAGLEREGCLDSGSGLYMYGQVLGDAGSKSWSLEGESRHDSGCTLRPFLNRPTSEGSDTISFHIFGYLIDE